MMGRTPVHLMTGKVGIAGAAAYGFSPRRAVRHLGVEQLSLPALNHSTGATTFGSTEVVIEYSDYKTSVR